VKWWFRGRLLELRRHVLVQNTVAMAMVQAGTGCVPLITIPYVARVLGVAGWGLVAFAQSFGMYLLVVGEYGFALSATREVARHRDDREKLTEVVAGVLGAKALLAAAALALAFGVHWWIPIFREHPLLLWGGMFWALSRAASMIWYFQGQERMRLVAWLDIVAQSLAATAIFLLVRKPADGWRFLGLQGLGFLLSSALGLGLVYREVPARMPTWKSSWQALRMGWSMFLFQGSVSLYTAGNAFILGLFVSPLWVGYYAGAEKISKTVLALLTPVSRALYPRLSHLVYNAREQAVRLVRVAVAIMGTGGTALGALVFFLAPLLVRLVLGPGYGHAVPVLRILALLLPLVSLSMVFGGLWMLPLGMDRPFNTIVVLAGAINLGLAIILARDYAAIGMACAVVTAETFVTSSMYLFLRRRKLDPLNYKPQVSVETV
jgi:PST family polysaccharide transporter